MGSCLSQRHCFLAPIVRRVSKWSGKSSSGACAPLQDCHSASKPRSAFTTLTCAIGQTSERHVAVSRTRAWLTRAAHAHPCIRLRLSAERLAPRRLGASTNPFVACVCELLRSNGLASVVAVLDEVPFGIFSPSHSSQETVIARWSVGGEPMLFHSTKCASACADHRRVTPYTCFGDAIK